MTPASCFLYVDPGSGSYLVQVIIAAVLGALFYAKHLWWRIRNFFSRLFTKDNRKDERGQS